MPYKYFIKNLVKKSDCNIPSGKIIQERKIDGKRVIKNIAIYNDGFEKHYHESVRMFTKDELVNSLLGIGFEIDSVFGDFYGSVWQNDFNPSPRIIIIARK